MATDVIAAIATPPGRGGIGVVRVSGPSLCGLVETLVKKPLPPRRAVLCDFAGADGAVIDQGIALYFTAPHSYTGEDVLELHGHGGPLVMQLLLRRCLELGARVAEPGEFTKRAFLNDKLDLAQAESIADLIDATTAEAARCALRSLQGEFSTAIQDLVRALTDLRLLVEATLDFPEEDIEFLQQANALGRLQGVRAKLAQVLAASQQGSLLREGMHVVLAGQPNVGKSSLLNRVAGEDLAIVTEVPGTTRDAIRQTVNVRGVPVHVIDTAGLRDPRDAVEKVGIQRTWQAIDKADLVLLLLDCTRGETREDRAILERLPAALPRLKVFNKIDLVDGAPRRATREGFEEVWLSAKTGAGVELLRAALLEAVGWRTGGEGLFMARERHLNALRVAAGHLARAAEMERQLEFFAEELRLARDALCAITGGFTSDDLLGEIFSRFCIGK